MKYPPRRARFGFRWRNLIWIAFLVYIAAAWLISPRAVQLAETEIRRSTLKAIYNAAEDIISQYSGPYGEIGTRADGTVAFVQTNTQKLTAIQTELCASITEELSELRRVSVRAGSLTPIAFLGGKGPIIPLRLEPDGTVEVVFENEFISSGVNQTLHRIRADVSVQITVRALWYTRPQTVQASFVLGETVIVGEVPGGLYAKAGT